TATAWDLLSVHLEISCPSAGNDLSAYLESELSVVTCLTSSPAPSMSPALRQRVDAMVKDHATTSGSFNSVPIRRLSSLSSAQASKSSWMVAMDPATQRSLARGRLSSGVTSASEARTRRTSLMGPRHHQ